MGTLRTIMCGVLVFGGANFAALAPAHADTDVYVGPDGARVYVDKDKRYRDRDPGYYYEPGYRPAYRHYRPRCYNRVSQDWRFGQPIRIVERVCYDRYGRARVVDRDYYRVGY